MKVYAISYDFTVITEQGGIKEPVHREAMFTDLTDFIETVQGIAGLNLEKTGVYAAHGVNPVTNLKVYSGELGEADIEKLLRP